MSVVLSDARGGTEGKREGGREGGKREQEGGRVAQRHWRM